MKPVQATAISLFELGEKMKCTADALPADIKRACRKAALAEDTTTNLFQFTAAQAQQQGPQPGEIVLQRRGVSEARQVRLPEKDGRRYFVEVCPVYDKVENGWLVQFQAYGERGQDIAYQSATAHTLPDAVAKIVEFYGAPLPLNAYCTEVYCYPGQPGDWYRTPVVLRGLAILTTFGQAIARFEGKRLVAADTAWRACVEEAAREYQKAHNQRLEDREGRLWTTWLLGCCMVKAGAEWEWRLSLEA